ncbi:MAG: copper resistance protein CopC [Methylocella sp.]
MVAKIWIVPAHGPQIPLTSPGDSSDPRLLIVTLPYDLAAGPAVIGYHILSVDGHVVEAQLTFTIKKPG